MLFEDECGNILMSEEVDRLSPLEIDELKLHVYEGIDDRQLHVYQRLSIKG